MPYYGIDFGTTSCIVACVSKNLNGDFQVECLSDDNGETSIPSIVSFESEKKYLVGFEAKQNAIMYPERSIELVKVRLGKTKQIKIDINGTLIYRSPQEISGYLLSYLNKIHEMKIKNAVITVPAYFDQNQKEATMQAGLIASISPKTYIEEPTAALMYHIFHLYSERKSDFVDNRDNTKRVLVFDFGGGTLDLSLVELSIINNSVKPKVIAIGGDNELGGNTIDLIFCKVLLQMLVNKNKNDLFLKQAAETFVEFYNNFYTNHIERFPPQTSLEIKKFIYMLLKDAEEAKISLSSKNTVRITIGRNYDSIEFTRLMFEEYVIQNESINIKTRIEECIEEIRETGEGLDEVLLVGGSSQIPFIKKLIIDTLSEFGINENRVILSNEFDTAVAKGAAIQSAILNGAELPPFYRNKCSSVVPRDIEVNSSGKSIIIVKKGLAYPFKQPQECFVEIGHSLSESVQLALSEIIVKNDKSKKREICKFRFYLPFFYTGERIKFKINISEDGLYQFEAFHETSKERVEFEPEKSFSLSDSEISEARKNVDTSENVGDKIC